MVLEERGNTFFALLMVLTVIFAPGFIGGCASSGGQSPTIPGIPQEPRPADCAQSLIYDQFGSPALMFGAVETGLAVLTIEEPGAKPAILKAYRQCKTVLNRPKLTYLDFAVIAANQFKAIEKYGPAVTILTNRIGKLDSANSGITIYQCDKKLLLEHCDLMIAAMGGTP